MTERIGARPLIDNKLVREIEQRFVYFTKIAPPGLKGAPQARWAFFTAVGEGKPRLPLKETHVIETYTFNGGQREIVGERPVTEEEKIGIIKTIRSLTGIIPEDFNDALDMGRRFGGVVQPSLNEPVQGVEKDTLQDIVVLQGIKVDDQVVSSITTEKFWSFLAERLMPEQVEIIKRSCMGQNLELIAGDMGISYNRALYLKNRARGVLNKAKAILKGEVVNR
jgi:hypothetical protein